MAAVCALTSPLAVFGPFGAPFMAARRPRACYRATFVPSPLLAARLGVPGAPWPRSNAVVRPGPRATHGRMHASCRDLMIAPL
jgi:hypothetical protein